MNMPTRGARPGAGRFQYKPRSAEATQSRIDRYQKGNRETYFDASIDTFTPPPDKDSWLRIMPPTWEGADHYALELSVHYEVGPDNNTYLCAEKMKAEYCPLCEERRRVEAVGGQAEYARALEVGSRMAAWVVNREEPNKGVLLWLYPTTVDRDILYQAKDRRTHEVTNIDDPENGYDIEFTRKGKGLNTKYIGMKLSRQPSAVDQKHIDFVVEHPLPSILRYYDAAHIEEMFAGPAKPDPQRAQQQDDTRLSRQTDADMPAEQAQPEQQQPAPRQPLTARGTPQDTAVVESQQPRTPLSHHQSNTSPPAASANAGRRARLQQPKTPSIDFRSLSIDDILNWCDANNFVIPDNVPDAEIGTWMNANAPAF